MATANAANRTARASRARGSRSASGARTSLLEKLLDAADLESTARAAVDWIVLELGYESAWLGTVIDSRLVCVAERGYERPEWDEIDAGSADHPLARALEARAPVMLGEVKRRADGVAIPIGGEHEKGNALGVLAVSDIAAARNPDVKWLASVLGSQITRLRPRDHRPQFPSLRDHRLLTGIVNAVTDPIVLTDVAGKVLIANPRAERLLSAPEDASEGWRRAVSLNNMLFTSALAASAVDQSHRRELLLVDPIEGSDLLFEMMATTVRDEREGTAVVSILRNITDLGHAAEEIRAGEAKLRAAEAVAGAERLRLELVLSSVGDPVIVTDSNGEPSVMNEPAERLFAVPMGSPENAQRSVVSNEARFSSFVSGLLSSGSDLRYRSELTVIEPLTGRNVPMEAVAGKVLSERGEITAIVTIFHDRTEAFEKALLYEQLKRASLELEDKIQAATADIAEQNELLRRQAVELEQASTMKSRFLANMSHELRTPLNAILGYTNMMINGYQGPVPPRMKRALERVDSNGRHLLAIINEILDITRIESGHMPTSRSEFLLTDVIREVNEELGALIARSKLTVTTEIGERMPVLESDRQKVKQVVVNLVANAVKFTPSGSVAIQAGYEKSDDAFRVTVTDTGIGIDPRNHSRIFEDFQQVDASTTRPYGGTGLGLSICRRFAELLGGRIDVQSALGKGSSFAFVVPRRMPGIPPVRRETDGGERRRRPRRSAS